MKNSLLILTAITIAGFISCSRQEAMNHNFAINSVFETDILPAGLFELEASQGGEIRTSTGTRIIVPAGAFTDELGNEIIGKVKIEFEEYHSPAEIIASGIPMTCKDGSGEIRNFESAGMFTINGKSGDKQLKVKEGKTIEVQVASNKAGNYDFFRLDVEGGNWQVLGSPEAKPNVQKVQQLEKLQQEMPQQPVLPKKLSSNLPLVELKVDYSRQPEFAAFKNVFWELCGTKEEIAKNKSLIASKKWQFELLPDATTEGVYTLNLKDKNNTHQIKVLPVLFGQDLDQARKSFAAKLEVYNKKVVAKSEERSRVEAEGNLIRGFQINSFGVYNCDRFYNAPLAIRVQPTFEFDKETYDPKKMAIFLIAGDVVIRYDANYSEFPFIPGEKNRLVAVLPGNELAVLSNREFNSLDTEKMKRTGKGTFKMRSTGRKIDKIEELNDLIASL